MHPSSLFSDIRWNVNVQFVVQYLLVALILSVCVLVFSMCLSGFPLTLQTNLDLRLFISPQWDCDILWWSGDLSKVFQCFSLNPYSGSSARWCWIQISNEWIFYIFFKFLKDIYVQKGQIKKKKSQNSTESQSAKRKVGLFHTGGSQLRCQLWIVQAVYCRCQFKVQIHKLIDDQNSEGKNKQDCLYPSVADSDTIVYKVQLKQHKHGSHWFYWSTYLFVEAQSAWVYLSMRFVKETACWVPSEGLLNKCWLTLWP